MARPPLTIGGTSIPPGRRATVELPAIDLTTHVPAPMVVEVVHGRRPGPVLFVCAAIHGDEIVGVEIIRRLLRLRALDHIHGSLLAIPIVNPLGFMANSRYLPDRRDLNRSFPGRPEGSLASRIAHVFMDQIVANASHGIDLHTAAIHRDNFPQIRADLDHPELARLARAFGVPVLINAGHREGSLRQAAASRGGPGPDLRGRRGAALRRAGDPGRPHRGCQRHARARHAAGAAAAEAGDRAGGGPLQLLDPGAAQWHSAQPGAAGSVRRTPASAWPTSPARWGATRCR